MTLTLRHSQVSVKLNETAFVLIFVCVWGGGGGEEGLEGEKKVLWDSN